VLSAVVLVVVMGAQAAPDVAVAARSVRPGEVLLVTVTAGPADAPVTVRAFERNWPVYALDQALRPGSGQALRPGSGQGRWRALVGIDLDTRPGRYSVIVTTRAGRAAHPLDVQRRTFPTRRLTVDPDLVNPPPEALGRIQQETRELAGVWTTSSADRLWSTFVRPVPDEANSAFGTRSFYNGEARSPHTGADFLSPAGRPVKAPGAGRVALAGARYFTGNTIVIDHGMGLFSLLAHLSEIDVHAGDTVTAGDVVGKVGATGRVTGAHLHWTVRLNGARVDPLALLYVAESAPGAEHEREQRGDRRNLADPEHERPSQHLDPRRGELVTHRRQPVVQPGVECVTQETDLVRQPSLESFRRDREHVFTPLFLFRVQQLDQPEGGVVAQLRSDSRRYPAACHGTPLVPNGGARPL
jgi:murein DD-endopeptidase MepM/ murein hydrolase activator NlpD